jgi:hypothetical protein
MTKSLFAFVLLFTSQIAFSAIHVGLSGSAATNNLGLEEHHSQAGKASIATDLGSYFRLSLSGQYRTETEEGHKDIAQEGETERLVAYSAETDQTAYALDLIAVLYSGELVTPFVFAGMAIKSYIINMDTQGEGHQHYSDSYPAPDYGVGLAFSLNKNFSLKITNTWSIGVRIDPEDTSKVKRVRDIQTDIGLSYKIE